MLKGINYWIIGGDFNMITSLEEKKSEMRYLEADILAFNQLIQYLKLIDLENTNRIFTWNNR